jgi:hypothetical protein
MLSATRIGRCIQARHAWKKINYPVFIPEGDAEVSALMIEGDVAKLAGVLERRNSLGSGSASALLGYLELMGALSGTGNPQGAIAWCAAPSKGGHPYAQYVLSWAYWETGNRAEAMRWMKRSAVEGRFLPAWVDLGRMLAMAAANKKQVQAAVTYLRVAHKLGHSVALVYICEIGRRGHLGSVWRLGCALAFPFCVLRAMMLMQCRPFSERSLTNAKDPKVPFFKGVRQSGMTAIHR